MKTTSMMLALVSTLALTSAGARIAHAQEAFAPRRGTVQVKGQTVKAVVVGPVAIHAYSAFSGAVMFVVNTVSGTDRDCEGAHPTASTNLAADRVQTLTVGVGRVACVATTAARGSELLWHIQKDSAASPVMMASRR